MALKLPRIIGHRGCAGYAPENTLEGIHTAADMGVEWVELDVKLTRDQMPVIFHDDDLERTTNGYGLVVKLHQGSIKLWKMNKLRHTIQKQRIVFDDISQNIDPTDDRNLITV